MNLCEPVFIGFDLRKPRKAQTWLTNPVIREVCSASSCFLDDTLSHDPNRNYNEWALFDSIEMARKNLEEDGKRPADYDVYAYQLYPRKFTGTHIELIEVAPMPQKVPADFEFLGFDVVQREESCVSPGCSPLACNCGADNFPVNQFCLIDELEAAWSFAAKVAKEALEQQLWEPGPYYVCQVFRQRR